MLAARNPVIFRKEKTTINSNLFFFFLPAVVFSSRPPWQAGYLPSKSNVCRLFVQMNTVAYLSVPGLVMSRSCGQSPARDGPDNFQAAFPGRVDHGAERNDDGHCQELHSLDDDDDEFLRVCCQNLPGSIRLYFGSRNVFYSPTTQEKTSPFASTVKRAQRNTEESSSSSSTSSIIIIWHCTKSIHQRFGNGVRTSAPRMALKVHGSDNNTPWILPVPFAVRRVVVCFKERLKTCTWLRDLTHTERGFASKRQVDSPAPSAATTWLARRTLHLCSSRWIIISHLRCSS